MPAFLKFMKVHISESICPGCNLPLIGEPGVKCWHCRISEFKPDRDIAEASGPGTPYYVLGFSLLIGGLIVVIGAIAAVSR
jgi:hypothetical protein